MIYQGDTHTFICSLAAADGTLAAVTTAPLITVFRASDQSPVITSQAMVAISGGNGLYAYRWTIDPAAIVDDYIAIFSAVTAAATFSNQFLEKIRVGDTRVTDVVAKDTTVAKDATVAHEATVAHSSDILAITPGSNATILSILTQVNKLPADPASNSAVTALMAPIIDIRNFALGSWTIDKTQSPNVLSLFTVEGSLLQQFRVFESATTAQKQAITS